MFDWRIPKRPQIEVFQDPLTRVLGQACEFQPNVGVPQRVVRDAVLRDAGVDPFNPPWPLYGKAFDGLYAILQRAFERSDKGLYLMPSEGLWGLTDRGVEKSIELNDVLDSLLPDLPENPEKGDKRDQTSWVVLELSKKGEDLIEAGRLEKRIRRDLDLPDSQEVFIPALRYTRGNKSHTVHLMEGYAFVAAGLNEAAYFKLERRAYVNQVMSEGDPASGLRHLVVIPNREVLRLKKKLRSEMAANIRVGDQVQITEGVYSCLEGMVTEVDGEYAEVFISLRSIQIVARFPRVFLKSAED